MLKKQTKLQKCMRNVTMTMQYNKNCRLDYRFDNNTGRIHASVVV